MRLWIVGQYRKGTAPNVAWSLAGIYDSEEKAVEACVGPTYFIWSEMLNTCSPCNVSVAPDFRYPSDK